MASKRTEGKALLLIVAYALALLVGAWATAPAQPPEHKPKPADPRVREGEPTLFPPKHAVGGKLGDAAIKAIVLTRFGGGQCSGTIIAPQNPDGSYHILTAWHCDPKGGTVKVRLWDQKVIDAVSVVADQRADIRWLRTSSKSLGKLPTAVLAKTVPPVGTRVWHRSFGIDQPGNLETGTVTQLPNQNGQIEYRISVSPGDSGGAAFTASKDEVCGPWCCTTRLSGVGRVWTGSCVIAWHMRPGFSTRETALEVARNWSDTAMPGVPTFVPILHFADHVH